MYRKYDNMFVGARTKPNGTDIGFITPDGDTNADEKRKNTVRSWVGNQGSTKVIPNTPMKGFKVVGSTTRYSTSNKFVQVEDPRGFIVELAIPDVLKLMLGCSVVHGEVQEELVWVRRGTANVLVRSDSADYATALPFDTKKAKVVCLKMKDIKVGDVLLDEKKVEWVYCGKLQTRQRVYVDYSSQNSWGNAITSARTVVMDEEVDNKPVDLFIKKERDCDYGGYATSRTFISKNGSVDPTTLKDYDNYVSWVAHQITMWHGEAIQQWTRCRSMVSGDGYRPNNEHPKLISHSVYTPRGKEAEKV